MALGFQNSLILIFETLEAFILERTITMKNLHNLKQNLRRMEGHHDVPMSDLLTDQFIQAHTQLSSSNALFEKSGFVISSIDDFKAIPDKEWDDYISSVSDFQNWQDMLREATRQYVIRQIKR